MRGLLDECVPRPIRARLAPHEVRTVPEKGWAGLSDGEIVARMPSLGFEVFLTSDQNVRHQLNLSTIRVALVIMVAPANRLTNLLPLIPGILAALATVRPGDVIEVHAAV